MTTQQITTIPVQFFRFTQDEKEEFFNIPGIFVCITTGGNYLNKFSRSWCDLLGYSFEELARTPLYRLIHPEDLRETMAHFLSLAARAKTQENNSVFSCRMINKIGKEVYMTWSSKVLADGRIFSFCQNTTSIQAGKEEAISLKSQDQLIEEFTETELKIFTLFAREEGECVTKDDLYQNLYGTTQVQDQTINVHISNLRKKLKGSAFTLKTAGKGRWKLLNKFRAII